MEADGWTRPGGGLMSVSRPGGGLSGEPACGGDVMPISSHDDPLLLGEIFISTIPGFTTPVSTTTTEKRSEASL